MRSRKRFITVAILATLCAALSADAAGLRPNIVFIMADDIGYGDLGCYNADSKIPTPNLDAMAAAGMLFTNGHSAGATCTPSRYSFITGEYAFRNRKGSRILNPPDPLVVGLNRPTVGKLLKGAGYATGFIGKWHLGVGPAKQTPAKLVQLFNGEVKPGPMEVGFDQCFYIAYTPDRVPMAYVENHHVYNHDPVNNPYTYLHHTKDPNGILTGKKNPELLYYKPDNNHNGSICFGPDGKGISRMGYQKGGEKALYTDESDTDTLTNRALRFIEEHKDSAFFLYFCPNNTHVPRYAADRFRGKTGCGYRGDALYELDDAVGRVMDKLKELGLEDNTFISFSGDNGGVLENGYADSASHFETAVGHKFNGVLRGDKGEIFEGGHRVPFIIKWPGRIAAGTRTDHLACHVDMLATYASITGQTLPKGFVYDSRSLTPTLTSGGSEPSREELVVQTGNSANRAILMGEWKYIAPFSKPQAAPERLFNLKNDLSETSNIIGNNASTVNALKGKLSSIVSQKAESSDLTPEPWPQTGVVAVAFSPETVHGAVFCTFSPRSRRLLIDHAVIGKSAKVRVLDLAGRPVFSGVASNASIILRGAGVYHVVAYTDEARLIQKVLVQ